MELLFFESDDQRGSRESRILATLGCLKMCLQGDQNPFIAWHNGIESKSGAVSKSGAISKCGYPSIDHNASVGITLPASSLVIRLKKQQLHFRAFYPPMKFYISLWLDFNQLLSQDNSIKAPASKRI
ncbi:hypothetical protein F2Q69_00036937 [Brassica cretica]|uniref:Uncharacterized protein n=1 Tax=Brassica cretica TaxID=69181 RepID=A0A8S9SSG7_BRACR|nr:hypothetical protein F2Q69_00036937 [Brassica cretica]